MGKGYMSGSPFHVEYHREKHYSPCYYRAGDECKCKACPRYLSQCYNSSKCSYRSTKVSDNNGQISQKQYPPMRLRYERAVLVVDRKMMRNHKKQCPCCWKPVVSIDFYFPIRINKKRGSAIKGMGSAPAMFCANCNVNMITENTVEYINASCDGVASIDYIKVPLERHFMSDADKKPLSWDPKAGHNNKAF